MASDAVARPEPVGARIDTEAKLRFLQSAAADPAHAAGVETIETHMSWLLLAREHVLKLKKPVRYDFLDFSSVEARRFYCREELRLNRRLAPDVYLGLDELRWRDGNYALLAAERDGWVREELPADHGVTLDWLVRMRRLPADRMLDRLLAAGRVSEQEVDALAGVLVAFYRQVPRIALAGEQLIARLRHELAINRRVLLVPRFGLAEAAPSLDALERALERHAPLLRRRADEGRIVEGHGDLRPEHVCLLDPPRVIDALEFNAELRQVDPFDELALLGLDCEIKGTAWIGPRLRARLAAALGDDPPPALGELYTAYRAQLRARLTAAHLLDAHPRTPGKWLPQARRYLARSRQSLDRL